MLTECLKPLSINGKNNPELNLKIIADLTKKESLIIQEIMAKYETQNKDKIFSKSYRLKEISFRYVSQADNIRAARGSHDAPHILRDIESSPR